MSYTYKTQKIGQEHSVIEVDDSDEGRVIARCREKDDADLIQGMFRAIESGTITLQQLR